MAIPKKLAFNLTMRLSLPIFAHSSRADVSFGGDGWMGTTYLLERRLLDALILTNRNFATFKSCHRQSNGRCSRGVYITPLVLPVSSWEVLVYTYRRGLLRCSFWQGGQCEGLDSWDEWQAQFPTLFRIYGWNNYIDKTCWVWGSCRRTKNKNMKKHFVL